MRRKCSDNRSIEITATPYFEDEAAFLSQDDGYVWTYDIEVANKGNKSVQIISRTWKIVDSSGNIREVNGEGVIGKKPIIKAGEKFNYTSYAQLNHSSGVMYGSYKVRDVESGDYYNVDIPAFSLDIPDDARVVH